MNEEYKPINNLWKDSEGYRYFGTLKLSSKIKYDGDDFIPLWEWINQLQKENKRLNGAIQTYDILLKANVEENKQLKNLIDIILNFSFFKEECPLNFGFENNTNEDKSQSVFYEDEWCENNCNDNYKDCWLKYFKKLQELERGSDE
jgi:hypothetical protein|nr:MAG TPA: hypothetical protein [Bacteriophage sp.]